jgi:hypothetical protein
MLPTSIFQDFNVESIYDVSGDVSNSGICYASSPKHDTPETKQRQERHGEILSPGTDQAAKDLELLLT